MYYMSFPHFIESIYTNIYDLHSRESSCSKFCLAEELVELAAA